MTNNTILITGGTSGIGRALAEAFHAKGNTVVIAGRRQRQLDEITAAHPGMAGIRFDAADRSAIDGFARDVLERFPELNVLVNNAGISKREDYTSDAIDTTTAMETIETNLASVVRLTSALLPALRARPKATVMATSSGLAFVPLPISPTYCATKAFVHSWLDSLRVQLRATSVEVLELVPPYVQTELGGPQQTTDPRAMPLDEFVAEVMQILTAAKTERGEILVDRVLPLRWAERDGKYDEMMQAFATF